MSFRNVFMAMVVVLCSGRVVLPETFASFTMKKKPPIVVVQDATGKIVASIRVGPNPEQYIFSKSSNTLYVVHDEGKENARLISAVNLVTKRVDREIKVGAGRTVELLISNDSHRLYCYTGNDHALPGSTFGHAIYGHVKPPFEPVITVIDTRSNNVIATYQWFEGLHAALPQENSFESWFALTKDEGHLIVLSRPFSDSTFEQPGQVAVFSGLSPRPTVTIDSSGELVAPMLSLNQSLLFVASGENGHSSGVIHIVDLQAGTTVNHPLNEHPTKLIRLGSDGGMWVLGDQEMRSVSETGELGDKPILLNKPRKFEEGDEGGATAFLNSDPGETIKVGEDHAAIQIIKRDATSPHRVALLDLKQLQMDSVVVTLSATELARIRSERNAKAFNLALLGAAVGYQTDIFGSAMNHISKPDLSLTNEILAARPDGRYLYALDLDSHKVTVIDVQAGAALGRIPVNHFASKLQVSSDGKHLHLIYDGEIVQKIDLETNNLEK
jgi:hypothetical protein